MTNMDLMNSKQSLINSKLYYMQLEAFDIQNFRNNIGVAFASFPALNLIVSDHAIFVIYSVLITESYFHLHLKIP